MAGHMIQSVPNLDLNLLMGVYVSENSVSIGWFPSLLSHTSSRDIETYPLSDNY